VNKVSHYNQHVFCCTNRRPEGHEWGCCASKDGERLRNYMQRKVKELGIEKSRVNGAGCLGRCNLGPCVVIYPEGVWYAPKNESDVDEIVSVHLQNGGRVERLLLP
jgi:(2Fe-2S) ferredoxin